LSGALAGNETLGALLQRVQASRERLAAVAPLLPPGLAAEVRAGPLDDASWTLLVGHAAAAAKLRQLLPALHGALSERGLAPLEIKVRVQPAARR
jgi:hypothetical protein